MPDIRLVLSDAATDDLVDIWVYVAEDSVRSADRLVERVREACALICDNPRIGRRREKLSPGLRSFPIGRYVIFYRIVDDSELQVARVLSGYRDIDSLF